MLIIQGAWFDVYAYGGYHAVYVPTEEDDLHVHDFIIEVIAP